MSTKEPFKLPELDYFDIFSILIWLTLLIPAVQLPNNSSFTFLRSIILIFLILSFTLFIAIKTVKEKRMYFYSATPGNISMLVFAASIVLSLIFSASFIDSLFGYDFSFASSTLVLLALLLLYFTLKVAGLSLEVSISRVFSALPLTIIIASFVSLFAYFLPESAYYSVLGNYATYFTFAKSAPFALLGSSSATVLLSVIALVVASHQITSTFKLPLKVNFDFVRKFTTLVLLSILLSFTIYTSFVSTQLFSLWNFVIFIIVGITLLYSYLQHKTKQTTRTLAIFASAIVLTFSLGLLWGKVGFIGALPSLSISQSESTEVLKQAFLNRQIPLFREFVGFGSGTYPYLYLQYRSLDAAKSYGNQTFFFKPATFIEEFFTETGLIGVISLLSLFIIVIYSYVKASNRKSLLLEFNILLIMLASIFIAPSSLASITVLILALAAFFDKYESLPEQLPAIRAFEIKETLYTNRSISRTGLFFIVFSVIASALLILSVIPAMQTIILNTKAQSRLIIGQTEAAKSVEVGAKTLQSSFEIANRPILLCSSCTTLSPLRLNSLIALESIYKTLPEDKQKESVELQQIYNLILAESSSLFSNTSARYDHWLLLSQAYRLLAEQEKSSTFYTMSLQSVKNALVNNPLSIEANYVYIDTLMTIGNTNEINTEIAGRIQLLKQLVGTPIQLQLTEAILYARIQQFSTALDILEKIKTETESLTSFTEEQKKQVIDIVNARIAEIKKAEQEANSKPQQTIQPSAQPTRTPEPTPIPTK